MLFRLGILTTHPIQYQAPWFRKLANHPKIDLTVFFCMIPDAKQQGDGFGVDFEWDVPLLDGYKYEVLENVSRQPSVTTFMGCDTPGIWDVVGGRRAEVGGRRAEVGGLRIEESVENRSKRNNRSHVQSRSSVENVGRLAVSRRRPASPWDAFIVNGWVAKSCLQLLAACRFYGVPCIVRGESNDLRPRIFWKRALHRLLLRQYDAFLNIGEANKNFYLKNGVNPKPIFFAPYCIENERFLSAADALEPRRRELRKAWGIEEDAVVFLFCGKFEDKKRPLDALKALKSVQKSAFNGSKVQRFNDFQRNSTRLSQPSALRSQISDLSPPTSALRSPISDFRPHLLMVGDGELKARCEDYARTNRLPVTFTGFMNQTELPTAYAAADCLVLPSDNGETWGLVVNEAMACGLPAIVSDQVGCHPDLVDKGKTGAVFPCGDIEALAQRMLDLSFDSKRLGQMGATAQRRVLERYNYDRVVAGTVGALRFLSRNR